MSSFFEKLIGGQDVQTSPVKKPITRAVSPAVRSVSKTPNRKTSKTILRREDQGSSEPVENSLTSESIKTKFVKPMKETLPAEAEEEKETTEEVEKEEEIIARPAAMIRTVRKEAAEKSPSAEEGQLAIDAFQTDDHIVIQSTIAGVKSQDLEVTIENGMVLIRGKRPRPETGTDKEYFLQECHWGGFSRQFVLPTEVDPSRAQATLKDGILTVQIPRLQKEKLTKLLIKE